MRPIQKLSYQSIVDLLHDAKKKVRWVSPSLTTEIAHALNETADKGVAVSVVVDIEPKRFQRYEGEIQAIDLLNNNPGVQLIKADQLGLGFIVVDNTGYAFFNPLRAYENDGDRFNAFRLDGSTVGKLQSYFFDDVVGDDQDLFNASESAGIKEDLHLKELSTDDIERSKEELKKDPPIKLNIRKLISVYRSRFQIVEMSFSGSNLHIKKVKLPKNALPFTDTRLKNSIDSQLRLFSNIPNKDFFEPFFDLKEDYDILRVSYLTYLKTREKNIIKKEDKAEFEKDYSELKDKIRQVKDDLIGKLQEEIFMTKTSIRDDLKQFFIANPTDSLKVVEGEARENGAEQQANDIVSRIHFPTAEELLSKLSMEKYYYDLTWEDLNNEQVIEEFKNKGLLDHDDMDDLKTVRKAYEVDN